jgi:hypothetical protein
MCQTTIEGALNIGIANRGKRYAQLLVSKRTAGYQSSLCELSWFE